LITIASLLGGPLSGAWLMAINYRTLGENSRGQKSILVGVVLSVVIILVLWFGSETAPIYLFPLLYAGGYHIWHESKLGEAIKTSREAGLKPNFSKAILPIVTGALIFGTAYIVLPQSAGDAALAPVISAGKAGGELRYSKITAVEAQQIADLLTEANHFGDDFATYAEATFKNGAFHIYLPAYRGDWENPELLAHIDQVKATFDQSGLSYQLYLLDEGLHGRDEQKVE